MDTDSWKNKIKSYAMILTFTNVVIPSDTFAPTLGGFPYTLWVGILVSIVLVILTFLATKLHPESKSDEV